jgi:hypothetical protein
VDNGIVDIHTASREEVPQNTLYSVELLLQVCRMGTPDALTYMWTNVIRHEIFSRYRIENITSNVISCCIMRNNPEIIQCIHDMGFPLLEYVNSSHFHRMMTSNYSIHVPPIALKSYMRLHELYPARVEVFKTAWPDHIHVAEELVRAGYAWSAHFFVMCVHDIRYARNTNLLEFMIRNQERVHDSLQSNPIYQGLPKKDYVVSLDKILGVINIFNDTPENRRIIDIIRRVQDASE